MNDETVKCKKDLEFSSSKNSMSMSDYSTKENTNVKRKNKRESEIQNESQKCQNFISFLFNIRKQHSNKTMMAHININYLRNKSDMLENSVTRYTNDF